MIAVTVANVGSDPVTLRGTPIPAGSRRQVLMLEDLSDDPWQQLIDGIRAGTLHIFVAGLPDIVLALINVALKGAGEVFEDFAPPVQDLTALIALTGVEHRDKMMRLVEDEGALYRYDVQSIDPVSPPGVVKPVDVLGAGRWIRVLSGSGGGPHAATHLPGGGDTIPDVTALTSGLMPPGYKLKADAQATPIEGTGSTVGAVVLTIIALTPPDPSAFSLDVSVVGKRSDNVAVAVFYLRGIFRRNGASTFQLGNTAVLEQKTQDPVDATLQVSGSTILVSVTGAAGLTYDWKAQGTVTSL